MTGRDIDHDGISLYREACLSAPTDIRATVTEDKRSEYGIVRIPVTLLKALNLSVQIRQDPRILGHVVIPELNAAAYGADKASFAPIKEQLAAVASEDGNIILRPSATPGSNQSDHKLQPERRRDGLTTIQVRNAECGVGCNGPRTTDTSDSCPGSVGSGTCPPLPLPAVPRSNPRHYRRGESRWPWVGTAPHR